MLNTIKKIISLYQNSNITLINDHKATHKDFTTLIIKLLNNEITISYQLTDTILEIYTK